MALLTDTIQIKTEPYNMADGNITTVRITKIWLAGSTQPDDELLEINPIPFSELGRISETLEKHYKAKAIVEELKDQYDVLKEECRRTQQDIKTIIKQPHIVEPDHFKFEMEQARQESSGKTEKLIQPILKEKPIHTEMLEPESPHQQAECIYDQVLELLKGKSVEEQDIMEAVLEAGVHPDSVPQVTKKIIELLKEKGAILTMRGKLKRLFNIGKKMEK